MDAKEIKTLCLRHVYGAALTEAERALVDDYAQTTDGKECLQECREVKDLLENVADVRIKPVDHQAMVERFERMVRQSFKQSVLQPWGDTYSVPIMMGLLATLLIVADGPSVISGVLLGICVLWPIAARFQRSSMAKILSRPDLYEYAKESRKRSDRILRSLLGSRLVTVLSGLAIAATSYGVYWGYREFGFIVPTIVIFVVIQTFAVVIYQYRALKRSDPEVWDWWAEEIKE